MHLNLDKGLVRIPLLGVNNLVDLRLAELSELSIRERLGRLCTPNVMEALYISSPEFSKTIEYVVQQSGKSLAYPKLLEIWLTFVKYYTRMCSRCTPYGLMASVGVINLDKKTFIQKEFDGIIHAQLDNGVVSELSYILEQSKELKSILLYFPNPSIYKQGNKLKYIEVIKREDVKVFALSKVETNVVINKILAYAISGKSGVDINAFLQNEFKGVYERSDMEDLVSDLISNQLLLSNYSSSPTKRSLFSYITETLDKAKSILSNSTKISLINEELKKIGKQDWNKNRKILSGIESNLISLNLLKDATSAFHFNLVRSFSNSSINANVTEKIKAANELIGSINETYKSERMEAFKAAFLQRYENRFILLTEVLDEETGIGYPVGNIRNSNADGYFDEVSLHNPSAPYSEEHSFNSFYLFLFNKISDLKMSGSKTLELTSSDIKEFATNKVKLPPTYSIFCTLLGGSGEEIDEGNFQVIISNSAYTSASSPINRFSVSDSQIETLCQEIFECENNIFEDKIVAEVLHTPHSRIENIAFRAVTRDYEIPIESLSTHDRCRQIKLDDIWVTVAGNRVKLVSKKNKKEIIPRISNSHSFDNPDSLPAYRFLGDLQLQDQQNFFLWRWGPLSKLDFLPRVVLNKHIICSLATWSVRLERDFFQQTEGLTENLKNKLFSVGLPRYVSIRQNNDNLLVIDLEDLSCLLLLIKEFKKYSLLMFHEYLNTSDNSPIKDHNGDSYVNELIIPYLVKKDVRDNSNFKDLFQKKLEFKDKRSYFPGDEFLYVKIYCTKNIGQLVLLQYLAPIFFDPKNTSDHVFFIRYEDPDYHIRLRIRKEDNSSLIPNIYIRLRKLILQKYIYRIQYDTYNRELNRYSSIPYTKTEMIFSADSIAIVGALKFLNKIDREAVTWIVALKNIYSYLTSFGMTLEEMLSFCLAIKNDFFAELNLDNKEFLRSLNLKLRRNHSLITGIIEETNMDYKKIYTILAAREVRISKILKIGEKERIRKNYAEFSSYIHMSINRLFASDQRYKEAMSYDLLYNFLTIRQKGYDRFPVKKK